MLNRLLSLLLVVSMSVAILPYHSVAASSLQADLLRVQSLAEASESRQDTATSDEVQLEAVWTEMQPAMAPGDRGNYSLAYDTRRNRIVLFGGFSGGAVGETWEWDGETWMEVQTTTAPSPRYSHTMVFDRQRGVVVLFGGRDNRSHFNDTWEYDGVDWRKVTVGVKPSARRDACATYDEKRGEMVLFGGQDEDGTLLAETWTYDGVSWEKANVDKSPSARWLCAIAYSPSQETVTLFGGSSSDPWTGLDDTWSWDGAAWTEHNTPSRPPARGGHALVYHPGLDQILLLGGDYGSCTVLYEDLWTWNGTDWRPVQANSPGTHSVIAAAYLTSTDSVLLFGGWSGGDAYCEVTSDTWELKISAPVSLPPAQTVVYDDIAYIRDGDIWLMDLTEGVGQQLTADGGNRWPSWSPDGRFLLYTHAKGDEQYDLYILDLSDGQPRLLAEDACCAAWEPEGERIAYVSLAESELSINAIQADGMGGEETLVSPLTYGRSVWPLGNMVWYESGSLLVPMEIISGSAKEGLALFESLFHVPFDGSSSELLFDASANEDCFWQHPATAIHAEQFAVAFVGQAGCDAGNFDIALQDGMSVVVADGFESGRDVQLFPGLSYPSLSQDGSLLAAEQYTEADDPDQAELTGIGIYDVASGDQKLIFAGVSQPAWRPGLEVDPVALRYLESGEHVVTLYPPLRLDGRIYRVSYFTTGKLRRRSAGLVSVFTPEYFKQEQITGIVVSADGNVITDTAVLRRIFTLYPAAYILYEHPHEDSPLVPDPHFKNELNNVLKNPLVRAMEPEHFLSVDPDEFIGSRRSQTAEALRGLLTDELATIDPLEPVFDQILEQTPTTVEDALGALTSILEDQYAYQQMMGQMGSDLAVAYAEFDEVVGEFDLAFRLLQLIARLLLVEEIREERASWLSDYVDAFPSGAGALDHDQLKAATEVLDEAKAIRNQRVNIAVDFGKKFLEEGLLRVIDRLGPKAVANVITTVASRYGTAIAAHTLASTLSAVSIGLTVNSILYGTDTVVGQFKLAERSEELRNVFNAGRNLVVLEASIAWEKEKVYDADLAARFRVAYLFEALAAIQTQRAYADGVAGTFQLPNPLQIVNWLRGEDWEDAVAGLRADADVLERKLIENIGSPVYIDSAVSLAIDRTGGSPGLPPVSDERGVDVKELPSELPIIHPGSPEIAVVPLSMTVSEPEDGDH